MSHPNREEGNVMAEGVTTALPETFSYGETMEARTVHPQSRKLFEKMSCIRHIPVAGPAIEAFGPSCTLSLAGVYLLSKGIGKNLLSYSVYPMFIHRYGTTPAVQQRMSGISSMGFSIKPLTAILSDTFAFMGFSKRWYMAISCLLTLACSVVYGVLPAKASSAEVAAAMIFLATFGIANIDVLSEGHYSRLIKKDPRPGAQLVSFIWAFIMIGTIIAAAVQGPLSDAGVPQVGIFICAGAVGVCIIFFVFNAYCERRNRLDRYDDHVADVRLLQEHADAAAIEGKLAMLGEVAENLTPSEDSVEPAQADNSLNDHVTIHSTVVGEDALWVAPKTCCCDAWEVNKEVISNNVTVTVYGLLLTAGVITLAILTILGSTYQLLYGCVVISVVLSVTGFVCIPMTVMKANMFGWIQLCSYILIPGALDNFYMADEACVPGGPHFSQTFYQTVGAVIGNVGGLAGVYLFAMVFSKRSYRLTCICTTCIQVVASLFDLIMVKRWNHPHMPDKALYILGDSIVYQVCYYMNYMPLNILISRLCPKGCESTMFAILASFSNLGASTSSTIGAILMETVWPVDISITPCDFSNVPWLIITGHLITPLICIPLVFFLLPGDRICDDLDPKIVEAVPIAQKWLNRLRGRKTLKELATGQEGDVNESLA